MSSIAPILFITLNETIRRIKRKPPIPNILAEGRIEGWRNDMISIDDVVVFDPGDYYVTTYPVSESLTEVSLRTLTAEMNHVANTRDRVLGWLAIPSFRHAEIVDFMHRTVDALNEHLEKLTERYWKQVEVKA